MTAAAAVAVEVVVELWNGSDRGGGGGKGW